MKTTVKALMPLLVPMPDGTEKQVPVGETVEIDRDPAIIDYAVKNHWYEVVEKPAPKQGKEN